LALQYVVTLFSGVVLCDWAISEVFNLPPNSIESLTETSLKCAIGVAILGAAFTRLWINPKTTLIMTALFSLGLTICFISVYIHWTSLVPYRNHGIAVLPFHVLLPAFRKTLDLRAGAE
jgi:hypothetical protein